TRPAGDPASGNLNFVNRRAATVVLQQAFAAAQPVGRAALPISDPAAQRARVTAQAPGRPAGAAGATARSRHAAAAATTAGAAAGDRMVVAHRRAAVAAEDRMAAVVAAARDISSRMIVRPERSPATPAFIGHQASQRRRIRTVVVQNQLPRSAMRRLAIGFFAINFFAGALVFAGALIAAVPAFAQEEPPARVGRVSFVEGQLGFHLTGETAWSAAK